MNLFQSLKEKKEKICIVGLGYVGLPLAVAFAEKFSVVGFDINKNRVEQLKQNHDATNELTEDDLKAVKDSFQITTDEKAVQQARIIIVTVPTPIDDHKLPDLTPVESASRTVGRNLSKGSIVVYESTVYPGVSRDICIPILEKESGLKWGKDFFIGYSPERINPGDKEHTVRKIKKVVSGDTEETLEILAKVYGEIIIAGIHKASTIEVAEAAKVIENTQRDLNIALINELALIFNKLNIDTREVLEAAGTKWNFLKFQPGLVGGHCIGVDPYYLTYKALEVGYDPEVILAGRKINDAMGKFIADQTVKQLINAGDKVKGAKVAILGFTFKENIPDIRNTRVIDIVKELKEYSIEVSIYDPYADQEEVKHEYGLSLSGKKDLKNMEAVIAAVAHKQFMDLTIADFSAMYNPHAAKVFIDVKGVFNKKEFQESNYLYWRL